ncbi:GOLPH3/VPS74 family protein [Salinispora pacifica]|uniref:GOLPH3/VPS74 family protein n=1 Tax=Salinispora pacifica TaxID=351187 RepID=UPI00067F4CD4|nr:GPP34 family phosphoprotein [Salinispora pacifica]
MNRSPGAGSQSAPPARHPPTPYPRAVGMAGGPLIANDFYFLSHDDQTGHPRLFPIAVSLGLAAGLLAELYFAARIDFYQRHVQIRNHGPTPTDWLQLKVFDRLRRHQQHTTIHAWLLYLAGTDAEQVAERMTQAGLLQEETAGPRWRRRTTYVPTDTNVAYSGVAQLSVQLRHGGPLTERDILLAGLAQHTQLAAAVLDGAPKSAWQYLEQQLAQLPPQLTDLLADLGVAVGTAVLSHRTS